MQVFIHRLQDCLEAPRVPVWLGDLVNIGYVAGCCFCWPVLYVAVLFLIERDEGIGHGTQSR